MTDRWQEIFEIRDEQRQQLETARPIVRFKDLPWEENSLGRIRWYMHPNINDTAMRSLLLYVQEIPPGSRSGKVKWQGGFAFYVWKGKGYTVINDEKHEWEEGDIFVLPVLEGGLVYQHFNSDPENSCRLIAVAPNVFEALGVDLGMGLEQLEDAPK
ncbi:hypothetical protein ACFLV4_03885 [Chloroflexota bacterium]